MLKTFLFYINYILKISQEFTQNGQTLSQEFGMAFFSSKFTFIFEL